ncbi:neisseria PilC domain-containing protein [Methyloglobulus morosus KoM1]|uniref:Neisseria PilC domain-containing protein n=2 Tax=Methyloglobulus TaxID=1410680 RepID=V5BL78_9GAMM|nr:neisseria PilC domain-containing protein [Methyloglobulus morosus KoM1]
MLTLGKDASVVGPDEGKEVFAYVPNAVISKELASLGDKNYSHQYFVDGVTQYNDVFYNGGWHSVLVGATGGGATTEVGGANGTGGKGVFALDVSHADSFSASDVLWEFTSRNNSDLGYTIPVPIIARMANGHWAAIVANGYNSGGGKAALFIIDIQTGTPIQTGGCATPPCQAIIAESAGSNGLSSPTAVDVSGDGITDYIYAGDLKGNMWKFDVTNTDPANWGVAYSSSQASPSPMFVALDGASVRQPITSKPAVSKAKATDQHSGVMVYFGTGKYFEDGDHAVPSDPQVQSIYGIWDKCDKSSASNCNGVVSGRSALQQQSIIAETSGTTTLSDGTTTTTADQSVRVTSKCEVAYGSTVPTTLTTPCTNSINRLGWFMDLVQPPNGTKQAERVVSTPIIRNTAVVFVTLIPTNATCEPSGTGWVMELDFNGARFTGSPIDINNDGRIDAHDLIKLSDGTLAAASGLGSKVGIIKTPAVVGTEVGREQKYLSGSGSTTGETEQDFGETAPTDPDEPTCDPTNPRACAASHGPIRSSWRQLR